MIEVKDLGKMSRRNSIYRFVSPLLLLSLFLVCFLYELKLISSINTQSLLNAAAPDEALFISILEKYTAFFRTFDFSIFPNGLPSGYGLTFWFTLFAFDTVFKSLVLVRAAFLLLKYIAFIFAFLAIDSFHKKNPFNWLIKIYFALFFIVTPGFWFYGKIISPEYLVLTFASISIFLLAKDEYHFGLRYFFAVLFSALAAYTKISALPFPLTLLILPFLFFRREARFLAIAKPAFTASLLCILALAPLVFLSGGISEVGKSYQEINGILPSANISLESLLSSFSYAVVSWDQIELYGLYAFLPILIVTLASIVDLTYKLVIEKVGLCRRDLVGLSILGGASISLLVMIFKVTAHTWYVFPPIFLFLISAFILINPSRFRVTFYGALLLVVGISSAGEVFKRIQFKEENNRVLHVFNSKIDEILQAVTQKCPNVQNIDLDILIPTNQNMMLIPLRTSLREVIEHHWVPPDAYFVNRMLQKSESPLLEFVIRERRSEYRSIGIISGAEIFINSKMCRSIQ